MGGRSRWRRYVGDGGETPVTTSAVRAAIRPLPSSALSGTTPPISPQVLVAVFLGSDYAASHPTG